MTIPTDNSSAATKELVQRLLKKNIELDNELRMASKAKVPSDPSAWLEMRDNYIAIILADHDFSELHEVEQSLWQLHYKRIEEFRLHINAALATITLANSHSGKGVATSERLKKVRSAFRSFLVEATGFYHDLLLKIRNKYGLPVDFFTEDWENQIVLANGEKKSAEIKKGLMSCHRCLIYLGDLARYKVLYGDGDPVARDFTVASTHYIQAASLCPSSGNPHHQLAILASYSGDELLAIYRYFRSLAVDTPFTTARDNLIIAFEKNRQSYSRLPRDAKASSAKVVPVRMNGRGRGRSETRVPVKDARMETPVKEAMSSTLETRKAFLILFVRLNGILFTRTSMETFGEVLSLVLKDLDELLSAGPEEVLSFGSDVAESGLLIIRVVSILIFTVHNVNKEFEGQSYEEVLQRTVLLQNAFTAAFEFTGHILKRCIQLQDISSSYLLPALLIFIEWLACHPDIATSTDVEEKQATARSFFWDQCISFLNKLILSGIVSIEGDEDETCFSDLRRYDEAETGNRHALWEDFELRGFLPLVPAQLILDFSGQHSFMSNGSKENRARAGRILAAGRALMNLVKFGEQEIYFDQKLKRFVIGIEPQRCEDNILSAPIDLTIQTDMEKGVPVDEMGNLGVLLSKEQFSTEGEEEDEVIVFKPIVAEKVSNMDVPRSAPLRILETVEKSPEIGWAISSGAFPCVPHDSQLQDVALHSGLAPLPSASVVSQPLQQNSSNGASYFVRQASVSDGLRNLSISGNRLVADSGSQRELSGLHPPAFSLPLSRPMTENGVVPKSYITEESSISQPSAFSLPMSLPVSGHGHVTKGSFQGESNVSNSVTYSQSFLPYPNGNGLAAKSNLYEDYSVSMPPARSLPFSLTPDFSTGIISSGQSGFSEPMIPSKLDYIMPNGLFTDDPVLKLPNLPMNPKKSPVSRPIRHFGPPPGFNSIPSKQSIGSMGMLVKNEHLLVDDYIWLDGRLLAASERGPNSSPGTTELKHLNVNGESNRLAGLMNFPFPGKHVPTVQAVAGDGKMSDYQLPEHLKLYREHKLYGGNQQPAPAPEQLTRIIWGKKLESAAAGFVLYLSRPVMLNFCWRRDWYWRKHLRVNCSLIGNLQTFERGSSGKREVLVTPLYCVWNACCGWLSIHVVSRAATTTHLAIIAAAHAPPWQKYYTVEIWTSCCGWKQASGMMDDVFMAWWKFAGWVGPMPFILSMMDEYLNRGSEYHNKNCRLVLFLRVGFVRVALTATSNMLFERRAILLFVGRLV
ncbi:hypothetical protein ACLOJK_035385 [Asimina triloba]